MSLLSRVFGTIVIAGASYRLAIDLGAIEFPFLLVFLERAPSRAGRKSMGVKRSGTANTDSWSERAADTHARLAMGCVMRGKP